MSQLSSQRMNVPLEILREIVEITFFLDYTAGPALALTCKSINQWITPLLYASVSLDKTNVLLFIRGIESAQCGALDTGAFVKQLCIHRNATQHCDWTLSLCKSVAHLLVCPPIRDYDMDEEITDASLWPTPWHIMVLSALPSWILPRLALFTHTTHLYLDNVLGPSMLLLCAKMPLTHICFNVWADMVLTPDDSFLLEAVHFLLELPTMQCLLIHAFYEAPLADFFGGIWSSLADIADERFIVAPGMSRDELIEFFEEGQTVWDNITDWKAWRQMARRQI
ncbi:hypothetical protein Clacol_002380 [Clathrus columnatus]|uniref:F-box domain-containing protein n=1 Tax=Clathrus columnatus TaxID=1419009 RepID=A0AAV5A3Z9_9AGAM|nr:hypothetical protein Clacol_002380 [Clathrus columnatus]